jgi:alpha-beta hydrolase superfamily lysophospholipase
MQAYEVKTTDGLSLNVRRWNDEGEQHHRAIAIIHGIGEHQGRYAHVAKYFIKSGYEVYSYDQRGHGVSGGKRGHSPGVEASLNDLDAVLKSVKSEQLYLYGHSFGGNVLVNYLLRRANVRLKAAVLSGAWMWLKKKPSRIEFALAKVMDSIFPSFTQSNQLDVTALSSIEKVGVDYLRDPLVHPKISVGLFMDFYPAGITAIENARQLKTPTLLIHGEDDRIVDPEGSREFAKNAEELTELRIYSNTRHELHNDTRAEEVLEGVVEWLKEK